MGGRRGRIVVVAVLAVAVALVAGGCGKDAGDGSTSTSTSEYTSERGVPITVKAPQKDAVVTSPLEVRGRLPGTWSFEADFPVEILDADRRTVVESYATVKGEWMTEEDVDFTARITFDQPQTATGFLVLRKANPSDLRKNDDSLEIPIRFEP